MISLENLGDEDPSTEYSEITNRTTIHFGAPRASSNDAEYSEIGYHTVHSSNTEKGDATNTDTDSEINPNAMYSQIAKTHVKDVMKDDSKLGMRG